jgi:hypothetical protein
MLNYLKRTQWLLSSISSVKSTNQDRSTTKVHNLYLGDQTVTILGCVTTLKSDTVIESNHKVSK